MGKRKILKETDVDMDDAKRPATQDSSESEDVFWTPSSLLKSRFLLVLPPTTRFRARLRKYPRIR